MTKASHKRKSPESKNISGDFLANAEEYYEWASQGICREFYKKQPEYFFDSKSKAVAKTLCNVCPVKEKCLQYAIDHDIEDGIWGGVDFTKGHKSNDYPLAG